jgi:hypothetical protein
MLFWALLLLHQAPAATPAPGGQLVEAAIEVWIDPIVAVTAKTSAGNLAVDVWTVRVCNTTAIYQTMFRERVLSKITFSTLPNSLAQTVLLQGAPNESAFQRITTFLRILFKRKTSCTCIYYGVFLPERIVLEPYSCGASDWIVTSPVSPNPKPVRYTLDRPVVH